MTDGPFKNLQLSRHWKRFAEAVQNDAVEMADSRSLAAHALLQEILTPDVRALVVDLQQLASQEQLDLDPLSSFENIFDEHQRTSFADTLQKELSYRLGDHILSNDAVHDAIESTVFEFVNESKSRIEEECIRARESGEMRDAQFKLTVKRVRETLEGIDMHQVCDAIFKGNKNTFKEAISKKDGLDEGPVL